MNSSVFLVSLIGALAALAVLSLVTVYQARAQRDNRFPVYLFALRILFGVLFVCFLSIIAFEVTPVRRFFGDVVTRAADYQTNCKDVTFLKRKFTTEDLRAFRDATTRALARRPPIEEELGMINKYIFAALDGPARENMRCDRDMRVAWTENEEKKPYFLVHETTAYTLHLGTDVRSFDFRVKQSMKTIPGVPDDSLVVLRKVLVDNDSFELPPTRKLEDSLVVYEWQASIPVTQESEWLLEWTKRLPVDDQTSSIMSMPTRGLRVSFRYSGIDDKAFAPRFYLLALRDVSPEVAPLQASGDGYRLWAYDGWLFRSQGWILTWRRDAISLKN